MRSRASVAEPAPIASFRGFPRASLARKPAERTIQGTHHQQGQRRLPRSRAAAGTVGAPTTASPDSRGAPNQMSRSAQMITSAAEINQRGRGRTLLKQYKPTRYPQCRRGPRSNNGPPPANSASTLRQFSFKNQLEGRATKSGGSGPPARRTKLNGPQTPPFDKA